MRTGIRSEAANRTEVDPMKNMTWPININANISLVDGRVAGEINSKLDLIIQEQKRMSAELAKLQKEVEESRTVSQSAITLIQGLKERLDAAIGDQAALKELSQSLDQDQAALAAAISANTPAAESGSDTGTGSTDTGTTAQG